MEEFKVPLREIRVHIRLREGEEIDGTLHALSIGPDGKPGRLIDRLNDADAFVPWTQGDKLDLLNKTGIVWVRVGANEPAEEPGSEDESHGAHVTVDISGGIHAVGEMHYLMPPERSRVLDYVNSSPRFIALRGDSGMLLVNCEHIVRIHEE